MLPLLFSSKQGVVTNFEIFRMREKQVPVDVVEMKGKCLRPVLRLSGRRAVTPPRSASLRAHSPAGWLRPGVSVTEPASGRGFSVLPSFSLLAFPVAR